MHQFLRVAASAAILCAACVAQSISLGNDWKRGAASASFTLSGFPASAFPGTAYVSLWDANGVVVHVQDIPVSANGDYKSLPIPANAVTFQVSFEGVHKGPFLLK